METGVVEYLVGKGIQTFRAAGPEVTAHCWFCSDGDPKGRGKLYINTESWLYDCKRCGESGNQVSLMKHFGDEVPKDITDDNTRRRLMAEAVSVGHEILLTRDDILTYLIDRGLDSETILDWKLGYAPRGQSLTGMLPSRSTVKPADLIAAGLWTVGGRDTFDGVILMPYWANGQVVQIREKRLDGKYRTAVGQHPRLFNVDSLRGQQHVLITEGEFDAKIVEQEMAKAGASMGVVGFPGATSFPPGWETYFDDASKVFIGADPDESGDRMAAKIKEVIGSRARIVQLPRELPKCDWTEYLRPHDAEHPHGGHTWEDVRTLLLEADLSGKRLFSLEDTRIHWLRQRGRGAGLKTGFAQLDATLAPGLQPGQVVIPIAKTGTGKTVFLTNLAHNMRQHRILYFSLELTAAEIYEQVRRIFHFHFPDASSSDMEDAYSRLRIVDLNRLSRHDVSAIIEEYAEELGERPEVVLIDYLGYFARSATRTSQYEKVTDAVMDLKAIAKGEKVVVVAPHQVNRGAKQGDALTLDDARDSGVIEETADFLLSLFRPDQAEMDGDQEYVPTGAFRMQLLKSRHGGQGRVFSCRMSLMSLAIVEANDRRLATRVEQENAAYRSGMTYEKFRQRQLSLTGVSQ